MFGRQNTHSYPITGTTPSPLYVPYDSSPPKIVKPGEGYFFMQIKGAQAAFYGSIWERVKRLIITSQVNLNHPVLGSEPLRAIQRSREVQRERAEQLGLSPNLIHLVPAVMPHISVSVDFILDRENRLAQLTGLINDDTFQTAIALAPGAAVAARTIAGLSQKIMQTFLQAEERRPILQFTGDFNIAGEGLKAGHYIILGTRDERYPIPSPLPDLQVRDGELLANGAPVTQLCYVVLDVLCTGARTRDLNDGAPWDAKLRQAEVVASRIAGNPLASDNEKKQSWQECLNLIKEAQILLLADANYLRSEANAICTAVYAACYNDIYGAQASRRVLAPGAQKPAAEQPDPQADRAFIGISPDEDLTATLRDYAESAAETRRILHKAKVAPL
jgi:hypothetical protein